ncbi:DUF1467 family protein [Palleronia caenipelagi]|uniref:DUF1467 family protein n=1 Tax=Palleronia caenipelagi TaxID=2489174 RepID=A0A547Q8Z3_9RHOB|nr:DUF1467 family protein [Palleronia caenipelagi]TRD22824.1 DUF1467 family protein [Palleronia caenipelagi]
MAITSAFVLFAVIWFMVFFILLPVGLRTQGDENEIVPGTHAGSPARFPLKKKALQTTVIGTVLWAVIAWVILSGTITVRDLDWFDRMGPAPSEAGGTGG